MGVPKAVSLSPDLWHKPVSMHSGLRGAPKETWAAGDLSVSHPPAEWLRMGWVRRQCHTHHTSTLPGAWGWRQPWPLSLRHQAAPCL